MEQYITTPVRRRLSDILQNGQREAITKAWNTTEAADDFGSLPGGTYVAHVQAVELHTARTGTPGVKIQFRVAEGEHAGRMLFHDAWLTPLAIPQTKRDCAKLGLTSLDQLENANVAPGRIRCKVKLGLRTDETGEQHNQVRSFTVTGIDEPKPDAFAPAALPGGTMDPAAEPPKIATAAPEPGDEANVPVNADTSFDPEKLECSGGDA